MCAANGCSYLEWICVGNSDLWMLDEMGWIVIVKAPEHPTAKFSAWLSEEKWLIKVEMLVEAAHTRLLGFNLLCGQTRKLPKGTL